MYFVIGILKGNDIKINLEIVEIFNNFLKKIGYLEFQEC